MRSTIEEKQTFKHDELFGKFIGKQQNNLHIVHRKFLKGTNVI